MPKWRVNCWVRRNESIHDQTTDHANEIIEADTPLDCLRQWLTRTAYFARLMNGDRVDVPDAWIHCTPEELQAAFDAEGGCDPKEPNSFSIEICRDGQDWYATVDYGNEGVTVEGCSLGEWNFEVSVTPESKAVKPYLKEGDNLTVSEAETDANGNPMYTLVDDAGNKYHIDLG
jgi:hypothetical protein